METAYREKEKTGERILFVNCCVTVHEPSRTKRLAEAFLAAYLEKHPSAVVEERNLMELDLRPLDARAVLRRNELSDACARGAEEFLEAEKFAAADLIVIAAPYWEMSFPALLRIYIEQISALNIAFRYRDDGQQEGLCRAKRMVYLTTAGGPVEGNDYGADYLRGLCGVYGIPEFDSLAAECMDIEGLDSDKILDGAVERAKELAVRI